jgi:hypothetical protein
MANTFLFAEGREIGLLASARWLTVRARPEFWRIGGTAVLSCQKML